MKRFFTAAVMASTALSLVVGSAAFAAVVLDDPTPPAATPSALTSADLVTAQGVCDAIALPYDTDGSGPNTARAEVIEEGATYVSGPTEVGSHSKGDAIGDITPGLGATFSPAAPQITGDPYRKGGSVNMFGLLQSPGGTYSTSNYKFEGQFSTTYAHPYTCDVYKRELGDPVTVPGGYYVNNGGNVCRGIVPTNPNWGEPQVSDNEGAGMGMGEPKSCTFVPEGPPIVIAPGVLGDEELVGNFPGGSINQTQTDTLLATETQGESYFDATPVTLGEPVICISPSSTGKKLPGAWVKKDIYTGTKCTGAWYFGTTPYNLSNYAGTNVPNLNDGSHNIVTVPVI